jgi:hypothetical protein
LELKPKVTQTVGSKLDPKPLLNLFYFFKILKKKPELKPSPNFEGKKKKKKKKNHNSTKNRGVGHLNRHING